MASEADNKDVTENADATFLKASSETRRLEREALPSGTRGFPGGAIFEQIDVEKISIDSYEAALESAQEIESSGVKVAKKTEKEESAGHKVISMEALERIPQEKVEVLTRSEQEIADEEKKLKSMKEKFAKLMSELPSEKPASVAPKQEPVPEAPKEKVSILAAPKTEPERKKEAVASGAAIVVEEKPAIYAAKAEEIKELSENFRKITMKKEEREKQERIRKMKKEIEDMLDGG